MQVIKKCEYCGKEFTATNGMQRYCNDTHYKKCVVCGELFVTPNNQLNSKESKQCCSRKCSATLRKQTNLDKYGSVAPAGSAEVQSKIKATNLERYGVEHPAQAAEIKAKTRATNLDKYGVESYMQTQEFREAASDPEVVERAKLTREATNLDKYGVKCIFERDDMYQKGVQTRLERTGYRYTWEDPALLQKSRETMLAKYGVDHPSKSEELRQKSKEVILEKYGVENAMQNVDIRQKAEETMMAKYGVKNPGQSPEIQAKIKQTMISRYGYPHIAQMRDIAIDRMTDPTKIDNLMSFRSDPVQYVQTNFSTLPSLNELASNIGIQASSLGAYLASRSLSDIVRYVRSEMEREVVEFIHEIVPDVEVIMDDRNIIAPLEIDVYIPKFKLGIECNPTSSHNSTYDPWGDAPKDYKYHQIKTNKAEQAGIFLFHLFGHEWTHKREIIKSMLSNLLNSNCTKIYARNCKVIEVNAADTQAFLEANHRQGNSNSKVRLGLEHDGHIVSLMTFGKMRTSIGTGSENLADCYELVRFCSVLNTSVVGGASKLMKYFIKEYSPQRIRSFSDRAHTSGKLYSKLGFKEVRRSDPGYVWVEEATDVAYHRINAQKQNIKQFLKDDSIDLTKTEREIMEEHGFVRVYDSGTVTWEWKSE